ncbi:hypothetical protein [Neosynechococcus sphagnicola]|uniref:hypothetical protein n=1 Tax=Neosynechococcus sphagnicola TaxID=1501145 RepID=UPI000AEC3C96|nr:hypothetical protein [Neosynechococcus sphagnicola]
MGEYYQLKRNLLTITSLLSLSIFGCVWGFYSLTIALNYLIGACAGVVYLSLLARNVEQLGSQTKRMGKAHFAVFVGVDDLRHTMAAVGGSTQFFWDF